MSWRCSLLILLLLVCRVPVAMAQAFGGDAAPVQPGFGDENPHLATLLQLQYQMQIIKRLIEHEKTVNEMVRAAVDIGIGDPALPPPSESLCRQIPGNIPCARAYGGMYADFVVATSVSSDIPPPSLLVEGDSALDAAPVATMTAMPMETLRWTDITCLAQKCTAIISPDARDPRARYRISGGETLPDGATIHSISAAGVVIMRDKRAIHLEPAPQA